MSVHYTLIQIPKVVCLMRYAGDHLDKQLQKDNVVLAENVVVAENVGFISRKFPL